MAGVRKSYVWKHVVIDPDDCSEVICNYCSMNLKYNATTTSNIKKHLSRKHDVFPSPIQNQESKQGINPQQRSLEANTMPKRCHSRVWDVMEKLNDTDVLCLLCGKNLSKAKSTSNLLKHIQRIHGNEDFEVALERAAAKRLSLNISTNETREENTKGEEVGGGAGEVDMETEELDQGNDETHSPMVPEERSFKTWDYIERVNEEEVKCKICKIVMRNFKSAGTSNLVRHIRRHLQKRGPTNSSLVKKYSVNRFGSATKKPNYSTVPNNRARTFDRKSVVDRAVLRLLVNDLQPFSMLKDRGFVALLKDMESHYAIPKKEHIVNVLIPEQCREMKTKIQQQLAEAPSVSIGVELWTHQERQVILSVSCHFISLNWKFCSYMLDAIFLEDQCNSADIAHELYKVFEAWQITSKVFCITTDPSPDMAAAVTQLQINHHGCFAHNLNALVQQALTNVGDIQFLKEKVLDVVRLFKSNPAAREALDAILKVEKDKGDKPRKLKEEVGGHWASMLTMFQRYVKLHEDVTKVLTTIGKPEMAICDTDLESVKECIQALEPFEVVAKDLSTYHFSSLSKVLPTIKSLIKFLDRLKSDLATELKSQMDQWFPNLEENLFPLAATYIDPRFKDLPFEDTSTCGRVQAELRSMIIKEGVDGDHEEVKAKSESTAAMALWSDFDQLVQTSRSTAKVRPQSLSDMECGRYSGEALILRHDNPLLWWQSKAKEYPGLSVLARQFLSVPSTAIPPHRLFTKQGRLEVTKRSQLRLASTKEILFLHENNTEQQPHP